MATTMPSAPFASNQNSAQRRNATCQRLMWGQYDSGRLAHLHAPLCWALFQVLPAHAVSALGLELVVQRLRVVVVDELERRARLELIEGAEDERVPLARWDGADVQLLHD